MTTPNGAEVSAVLGRLKDDRERLEKARALTLVDRSFLAWVGIGSVLAALIGLVGLASIPAHARISPWAYVAALALAFVGMVTTVVLMFERRRQRYWVQLVVTELDDLAGSLEQMRYSDAGGAALQQMASQLLEEQSRLVAAIDDFRSRLESAGAFDEALALTRSHNELDAALAPWSGVGNGGGVDGS
jgi:hypothetical protein